MRSLRCAALSRSGPQSSRINRSVFVRLWNRRGKRPSPWASSEIAISWRMSATCVSSVVGKSRNAELPVCAVFRPFRWCGSTRRPIGERTPQPVSDQGRNPHGRFRRSLHQRSSPILSWAAGAIRPASRSTSLRSGYGSARIHRHPDQIAVNLHEPSLVKQVGDDADMIGDHQDALADPVGVGGPVV